MSNWTGSIWRVVWGPNSSNVRLLLGVCVCLAGWPRESAAQGGSQAKAAAEALFDEGLALLKTGKNSEACSKLEQSQRIDPAVGTLLYLGECYARAGRTASAWATFREAGSLASVNAQEDRAARARKRAAELEPELAFLTISIPKSVRELPGLVVRWGDDVVDPAGLGSPLPVDPVPTRLEVTATAHEPFVFESTIEPRSRGSIDVPMLTPREASSPSAAVSTASHASVAEPAGTGSPSPVVGSAVEDRGSTHRTLGLAIAGAGVLGVGVGAYYGLSAMSKNSEAEDGYCDDDVCQRADELELVDTARSQATVSTIALTVGSAAIIGGLLLHWMAPESETTAWSLLPGLSPQELSLGLRGQL